jgi:hypothetical protein
VPRFLRRPAFWVFAILLGSYAYFWHSRDWNISSRLMLTYGLVDRGTVVITGLDQQTEDKARFQGQYYSDKPPGYSLLATVPYAIARWVFRVPPHPLNVEPVRYWAPDYWVTLATSGLFTAAIGALLVFWSRCLGCSAGRATLIGLAYGLSTPAFVYATLAYGHQATAFALFGSFFLLWRRPSRRSSARVFMAGLLAGWAALIDLSAGPASAILGFYLLVQCLRGQRRPDVLAVFGVGAVIPALILLGYNQLAFGSPWDFGYPHHATYQFAKVHNPENPLGLRAPAMFWSRLASLLWGRHRGLAFFAPIVVLAVPGWVVLAARKCWDVAAVTLLVALTVLTVNLFYPEWTGGWSTGPRLLVPSLPFVILPVAALLAGDSRPARAATIMVLILALAGGLEMLLFQGVDGRVPQDISDPLAGAVWPLWRGEPVPGWRFGERFSPNLVQIVAPRLIAELRPSWQWLQFLPLVLLQGLAIGALSRHLTVEERSLQTP